jgi:hypothetical protein
MKTIINITICLLTMASNTFAQQVTTVDAEDTESTTIEPVKKELRNPFASSSGVTKQSSRLIREALNATKILGIIHMDDGTQMAVLKIMNQSNPLFITIGSTFSIEVSGREWRDVEVKEISKFEVKVTPKGIDSKIIIR